MKFNLKLEYFTLSVDIAAGNDIVVLLGPSGCGKTSILKSIAGLMKPAEGFIKLNERTLFSSRDSIDLKPRERKIGLVFQDYALFPHMTVEQNVRYGPANCPSLAGRAVETEEILNMMKIAHLKRRHPKQLSGGEKQRVALARTLIMRPELLLLDEPLSALDADIRLELQSELKDLQRHWDIPFILVTHDREEAARLGDATAGLDVRSGMHEFKHLETAAIRTG